MKSLFKECQKYNISIWKCPHFLFVVMGIATIVGMLTVFWIIRVYDGSPETMIFSVFIVSMGVFIPGTFMVRSFEHLAEANRMKSEFVSIASHQLRSPMSAIKWSLNLLLSEKIGKLEKKPKEHLKILEENNNRMIKLVNDLLNVSRIDKGELTLKKEKIDLKKIVDDTTESLIPSATSRGVKLIFNSDADSVDIVGDDVYVGMAVNNFIDNAIKYSKEDGGRVEINLIKKNKLARFEVKDNGIGISKEDQKKIFDKFFRAQNAQSHQISGTGLGLFIVKSVVSEMGGRTGLESVVGEGSTFWFEVPTLVTSNK